MSTLDRDITKSTVTQTCSVEGCDREVSSRGWCRAHYERWYKYGDPMPEKPIGLPRGKGFSNYGPICTVPGCTRPHNARGLCHTHYLNHRREEREGAPDSISKDYQSVKYRIQAQLGVASEHLCAICLEPAQGWSYMYPKNDPFRRTTINHSTGKPQIYSTDESTWQPLCRSHRVKLWRWSLVNIERPPEDSDQEPVSPELKCSIMDCGQVIRTKTLRLCSKHYIQWRRTGHPLTRRERARLRRELKASEGAGSSGARALVESIMNIEGMSEMDPDTTLRLLSTALESVKERGTET